MEVDAAAANSKQVYKPAKLAPVYYGQSVFNNLLFFRYYITSTSQCTVYHTVFI